MTSSSSKVDARVHDLTSKRRDDEQPCTTADRYHVLLPYLCAGLFEKFALACKSQFSADVLGADAATSPLVRSAGERGIAWALQHGVVDDAGARKLREGRFAWLCAGAAPRDIEPGELDLLTDTMTWFFVIDDVVDSPRHAQRLSIATVRRAFTEIAQILVDPRARIQENIAYGGIFPQICSMTRSVAERLRRFYPSQAHIVVRGLKEWLESVLLEYCYHRNGVVLDESAYLSLRSRTIGAVPTIDLLSLLRRTPLLPYSERDAVVHRIYDATALMTAFVNDAVSLPKELAMATSGINNIVTLRYDLLMDCGASAERIGSASADYATTIYAKYQDTMATYLGWLPSHVDPDEMRAVMQNFDRSCLVWHLQWTDRYGTASGPDDLVAANSSPVSP